MDPNAEAGKVNFINEEKRKKKQVSSRCKGKITKSNTGGPLEGTRGAKTLGKDQRASQRRGAEQANRQRQKGKRGDLSTQGRQG